MAGPASDRLPPGVTVFERGWLSANNILCQGPEGAALIDSGYATHSDQTLALLAHRLAGAPLERLFNTHLHSDHCGGNAALQACHPGLRTAIPPGEAAAVRSWDEAALSYRATGQLCPRFHFDALLRPGGEVVLAGRPWQVHAAPGHDPHSVLFFEPESRTLVSADALWENGFGVVFPELDGQQAFAEVGATLDLIESLAPATVIPGHGPVFGEVGRALETARRRLDGFVRDPGRHALYAAKVLLKFKLLELQQVPVARFTGWAAGTPLLQSMAQAQAPGLPPQTWAHELVEQLCASGAARLEGGMLSNA
ncbi:MAG: MBL fold metallo-hydrolase [Curvibacter sp.]|nr:MBL fold metallo-hydrolase [Curvibacter sp.]